MAHHGFAGATRELYRAAEAHYALWPSTEENIADNITREANDYLLHHSGVRRHLIGGNGTIRLAFPPRNGTGDNAAAGTTPVDSPMPGTILDIKVSVGQAVKEGELVCILEAMKMENEIYAPCSGTVAQVLVTKGQSVDTGTPLVSIS